MELDVKKAGALLQEIVSEQGYRVNFPGAGSAHQKRKVTPGKSSTNSGNGYQETLLLPENQVKLQTAIEAFFHYVLTLLREDPNQLATLVNDLLPLFLKFEIRIRIYPAYRQFSGFETFLETLEKINEDFEIENFELFCSALFGFYSQQA